MFKVNAKNFKYENFTISALLDLIIDDKVIFFEEEFSLSDSVPLLLKTITSGHTPSDNFQNENLPLFICSCGSINCNFVDYKIEHKKNFVLLSNIIKKGDDKFKSFIFNIPLEEYTREIVNLGKELINFENVLKKMISDGTFYRYFEKKGGILDKMEEIKKLYPSIFEEVKILNENIEIEEILKTADIKEVIKIIKKFPWKEDEVVNCLSHPAESIRYKSAEILGLISSSSAVPKLIETLIDESEAVRYSASRALSKIGILKTLEFMDELYLRRKFSRGCVKGRFGGEKLRRSDAVVPLTSLLREENDEIISRVLKTIDKLSPLKDKRTTDALVRFVNDKNKNPTLRKEAVVLLNKINPTQSIYPLLEILKDKREEKFLREAVLKILTKEEHHEIDIVLKEISEDIKEEENFRKISREYLTKKEFSRRIFSSRLPIILIYTLIYIIPLIIFTLFSKIGVNLFLNLFISFLILIFIFYLFYLRRR